MMGLRLAEGVELDRLRGLSGRGPDPAAVADLVGLGLLAPDPGRLVATPAGRAVLNGVLRALL